MREREKERIRVRAMFNPCVVCLYGDRPLGICRGLPMVAVCRFCARVSGR